MWPSSSPSPRTPPQPAGMAQDMSYFHLGRADFQKLPVRPTGTEACCTAARFPAAVQVDCSFRHAAETSSQPGTLLWEMTFLAAAPVLR